jgi:hypothetical protein
MQTTFGPRGLEKLPLPPHCRPLGDDELHDRGGFDQPGDPGGEESGLTEPWYYLVWYAMGDYYALIEPLVSVGSASDVEMTADAYEAFLYDYATEDAGSAGE